MWLYCVVSAVVFYSLCADVLYQFILQPCKCSINIERWLNSGGDFGIYGFFFDNNKNVFSPRMILQIDSKP